MYVYIYLFDLVIEQVKSQCLCSVEPKDASETSKIKTKLEHFCT